MLVAIKPGLCFKAQQCRRSNYLYAVEHNWLYPLFNLWVGGSSPLPDCIGIAQQAEQQTTVGSSPTSRLVGIGEMVTQSAMVASLKTKYIASLKMVEELLLLSSG